MWPTSEAAMSRGPIEEDMTHDNSNEPLAERPRGADVDQTSSTTGPAARAPRRWLGAGVVAVVLGAVLLGGSALAQDGTSTGTDLHSRFIDRLAEKLGLTT